MLDDHTKTQGLKSHYKPSLVNIPLPALCELKSLTFVCSTNTQVLGKGYRISRITSSAISGKGRQLVPLQALAPRASDICSFG